jgi:hypothetical protein
MCGVYRNILLFDFLTVVWDMLYRIVIFQCVWPREDSASPYSGAIIKFMTNSLEHHQIMIFSDGNQTRDFVFVKDDVVQVNLRAMMPDSSGASLARLTRAGCDSCQILFSRFRTCGTIGYAGFFRISPDSSS